MEQPRHRTIEIIPALLEKNFAEVKRKIRLIEPFVDSVQIDIEDGKFVPNFTFTDLSLISNLNTKLDIELHLMVIKPEEWVERAFSIPIKRIIFHIEAADNPKNFLQKISDFGFEPVITFNAATPVEEVIPYLDVIKRVQVMSVDPGFQGQKFQEHVLVKIRKLRKLKRDLVISVDGGVTDQNAPQIVAAGANILCVGSFIFGKMDSERWVGVAEAINKLKAAAQFGAS